MNARTMQVVTTICDLLDRIQGSTHGPRRRLITFVPDRPGHDRRYAIDAAKIEQKLGWRARETFDTGLEKTVRWYLDNRYWWQSILDRGYQAKRIGRGSGTKRTSNAFAALQPAILLSHVVARSPRLTAKKPRKNVPTNRPAKVAATKALMPEKRKKASVILLSNPERLRLGEGGEHEA